MMRTVVLHIGAPKAGSTFLQRAMLRNRDRLAQYRIAYPHHGQNHPGNAGDLRLLDEPTFARLFEGGARTVVLSHEDLFARPGDGRTLARLARAGRVRLRVLCFLRPWSEFCAGDYSQHLKQHFDRYLIERRAFDGLDFEGLAAKRAREMNPVGFLSGWDGLAGEPVTVASHRRIPEVMEATLGVAGLDWTMPRHLANPSLRLVDCEAIAAMIHDHAVPNETIRRAFREAHHHTAEPDPARSAERMAAIETMFEAQNAGLLAARGFDNRAATGPVLSATG